MIALVETLGTQWGEDSLAMGEARVVVDLEARATNNRIEQQLGIHLAECTILRTEMKADLTELKSDVKGIKHTAWAHVISALTSVITLAAFLLWYIIAHPH